MYKRPCKCTLVGNGNTEHCSKCGGSGEIFVTVAGPRSTTPVQATAPRHLSDRFRELRAAAA